MSIFNELLPLAAQVRDATEEGENTGIRVGDLFVDIIQAIESYVTDNDEDKRDTKNELIKRILGRSESSNAMTDPFKYIDTTNKSLADILDNAMTNGRYRLNYGGVLLDLDVFVTGANTTQLLRGFVSLTNGAFAKSLQYNEYLRIYSADAWGDWEIIAGKAVKELINSNVKNIQTQGDNLLKRIQGTSENSNAMTDPFKYINANNSVELVNVLNSTSSSGRYRIRLGNILLDLDVFDTGANTTQLLRGFVTPTDEGWATSLQYNEYLRIYSADAWGDWEIIAGKAVKELINSNAKKIQIQNTQISALVGDDKYKSVRAIATELIAEVVNNAPDDLDTLKKIADYIASDKTGAAEINNKISEHTGYITDLRKRIQGTSENSNAMTDPFKYIDTTNKSLADILDDAMTSGRYRLNYGGVLLDLDVFVTGANTTQLLRGFVSLTNGAFAKSLQYNEYLRIYSADAWGDWEIIAGKVVKELIKIIESSAVDANSFEVESLTDSLAINFSSISGEGSNIELPIASDKTAGVMSADMLNAIAVNAELIENKVILPAGNANTNANYDASDYIAIPNSVIDLSASGWIAGGALLVAFYDSAKTFISGYGNFGDTTSTFYSITHYAIPENARYVRYSSNRVKDKTILVWGNREYNKNIDALLPISIEWIDGEFVNRGGVISFNSTWCRSDFVDVSEFSGITIKAYNRGTVLTCAFYDADLNYISGIGDYGYSAITEIHTNVVVPANAKYIKVTTAVASKDDTVFLVNGMRDISQQEAMNSLISQKTVASLQIDATADKVAVKGASLSCANVTTANIPAATTKTAGVMSADMLNTIAVNAELIENKVIYAAGNAGTNTNYDASDYIAIPNSVIDLSASGWLAGGALLVAFYDSAKTFISGYGNFGDTTSTFYSITHYAIPENARYVRYSSNRVKDKTIIVWGNREYNKGLGVLPFATQTIPAQFYRKQSGDSLRVLCFGSSWLTNTWWYLNKLTQAVGINATIKCYFSSACPFSKWVDRYEGKEETGTSTDFRRFDSVNGSDWNVEYVTDTTEFKRSLEEDWDVIVFQQGATSSIDWDSTYEPYYSKLMSYIKRSAKPWTVICYNNTWTPKLGASQTLTKEAQKEWQELNNENCIRFTNLVGLSNFVIPCGSAVWALRNDTVITSVDDFVSVENNTATYSDNLHLKNGLPLYLTGLTLFRSIVTPFYGIDIDEITWLPDENTQKNLSSGKSWTPIDSEQAARVKQMVKLAFSNRYGFYTL